MKTLQPQQKKNEQHFLPKIDGKEPQNKTIVGLRSSQVGSQKRISSLQSTPKAGVKYNIQIKKATDTPQKTEKRNSLDEQFQSNQGKRNSSVFAKMKSSSSQNIMMSANKAGNDSPRMNSRTNVTSILQQKQRVAQQNQKKHLEIPSNTVSHFFSRQNLTVPTTQNTKVMNNQSQLQTKIKPELSLDVLQRNAVVYDESPAKMQQLREVKKQVKEVLSLNLSAVNQPTNQQQKQYEHIYDYPSNSQRNTDFVLEMVMERQREELGSCEKSPNINQLLSPISPTPKIYQQFIDQKKNAFNFNDNKLFGEEALNDNPLLKFNKNYKQLEKIVQVNSHFNAEGSLDVAMLQETMGKNVLPRKLGLVKDVRHEFVFPKPDAKHKIDLSNQNISQRYHEMISSAMKHDEMSNLYSINLASNNLTGDSLKIIAKNLPTGIQKINLEQNNLGTTCAVGVLPLLNTKVFTKLRILNLENNNISDYGFSQMLDGLLENRSVYSLNLSHNKLTDGSGDTIRQLIKNSSYIQELYLHWNKISSQGGLAIAEGLEDNKVLTVLDLSHNGLGALQKLRCGLSIVKNCSIPNTSMRHLDLSFNMFQKEEAADIAKFLEESNRTLFGIHFEGNHGQGVLDTRGFLKFNQSQAKDDSIHQGMIEKRRIKGLKCLGQNKLQNYDCSLVDNCWICDGWQEVRFEVKTGCSDSFLGNPVFLHLDFENFRPHYMDPDPNEPDTFVLYRMCPPNRKIFFFFSDPTQPILYYSKHYPYTTYKHNDELDVKFYTQSEQTNQEKDKTKPADYFTPSWKFQLLSRQTSTREVPKKYFQVKYMDTTIIEYIQPRIVNCIETKMDKGIFLKHDFEAQVIPEPRQPETFFPITKTNKWCFEISLFRTYIRDTKELFDKCFESDWAESRLDKVLSQFGDAFKCKAIFKSQYKAIKNAYKFYASVSMVGDIPSITQNQYSNLLLKCKVTDGKLLKISDVDISFVTTNANINKNSLHGHRNPDKAVVRYEFLEALGRLALDKYIRSNQVQTSQEAVNLLINDPVVIQKFLEVGDHQEWRDTRYWNEQCDMVLKKYLGFIKILWETIADSKKTEKRFFLNYKTMNLFEFQEMVKYYDLLDDYLTERDVLLSYNLAMMTQEDELNSDRYIQMNFVEFLEGLARLAEKKSMVPIGDKNENYSDEERRDLSLHYKLESMLEQMQQKYEAIQIQKRGEQKQKKDKQFVIKQTIKFTPLVPDTKATQRIISSNQFKDISDPKINSLEKMEVQDHYFKTTNNANLKANVVSFKRHQQGIQLTKKRSVTPNQVMRKENNLANIKDFLINSLDQIDNEDED